MTMILFEEKSEALGTPIFNHMYEFLCNETLSIEVIAYKVQKKKSKIDFIISSIYSSGISIADIYYSPVLDQYILRIIKNELNVTKYDRLLTKDVIDQLKIFIDNISHELCDIFYYEIISYVNTK